MQASETPAGRLESLAVPGIERAVGYVRRWFRDLIGTDHPYFDEAAVCLSELLTNALRHTESGRGGQMRVAVAVDEKAVRVEVTDDGCAATVPHIRLDDTGESGRGLRIVEAFARDWGVERRGAGHAVWFTVGG